MSRAATPSEASIREKWTTYFSRPVPNKVLRSVIMFIAVYFLSFSIALSRTSLIGTSCIASIPNVCSYIFYPITIGTFQLIMNLLMIVGQVALYKHWKRPVEFWQLIWVVFFSAFVDFNVYLLQGIDVSNYVFAWLLVIASIFILGFAIHLELLADVVIMPGEGIVLAISRVSGIDFAKVKISFDVTNVAVAAIISFLFFGWLNGVREGTVVTAIVTGFVVGLMKKLFSWMYNWVPPKPEKVEASVAESIARNTSTPLPLVVTIGRQYGSGGHEIGRRVADKLQVSCYDRDLVSLVADELGVTEDYVEENEERVRGGLFYMQAYEYIGKNPSHEDRVFLAQADTITKLSEKSCVIVGRLANHILHDRPNTMNVFICAPLAARIEHVMKREGLGKAEAEAKIERVDAERARRCKRYTEDDWGTEANYDLKIDSSKTDVNEAAQAIIERAEEKLNAANKA